MPRALITGITGQDGQHLAELLHAKGYEVFGIVRGQNNPKAEMVSEELPVRRARRAAISPTFRRWSRALEHSQPDEVYNLAAISFVALSFKQAELTANITGLGVLRMLEAIRMIGGSAEQPDPLLPGVVVGDVRQGPRDAAERADAVLPPVALRRGQGLRPRHHGELPRVLRAVRVRGILFNHEGERRGIEFVTRKITNAVARIKLGLQDELVLGNLEPSATGATPATTSKAMWLMLQQDEPDDYVVATARPTPSASSSRRRSRRPASTTGSSTSSRTRGSSARPRSTCSSATPPRPATSSAGSPRSTSGASSLACSPTTSRSRPGRPSAARPRSPVAQGSSGRSWNASTSDSSSGRGAASQQREQQHPQREHRHRRTGDEARLDAEQQVVACRSHGDERDDAGEPPDRHACVAVQGDDRLRGRDRHHVERARRSEHREVSAPQVVVGPEEDADDERTDQERTDHRRDAEPGDGSEESAEPGAEVGEATGADQTTRASAAGRPAPPGRGTRGRAR